MKNLYGVLVKHYNPDLGVYVDDLIVYYSSKQRAERAATWYFRKFEGHTVTMWRLSETGKQAVLENNIRIN